MVLLEGLEMKVERIPKSRLTAVWRRLSNKPFPKVKALRLSDENFEHVLEHRHCPEDSMREIEEWGRILSTKGTDACVFNADEADDSDYVILVRRNPYHSLEEIIQHELTHIARGDL